MIWNLFFRKKLTLITLNGLRFYLIYLMIFGRMVGWLIIPKSYSIKRLVGGGLFMNCMLMMLH
ncbi:hypothetical protein IPC782_30200 [Pseudomonas aeruginosa]|nr:hypothetical protein IPC782_30200 [Pseudomonas aeruginosa]